MYDTSPVSENALEEVVAHVRRRFSTRPKVAFAGFGKAGKSSLFNAVYGEQVAKVSMRTDETRVATTRERFGVDFTDTPGIGTARFSLERVEESGALDRQHVVVHVLNGASAVTAEDERLHALLEGSPARRVTVVNKADLLEPGERDDFAASVHERLGLRAADVLFVSARHGEGVSDLVHRIADVLPDAMQDAFIAHQAADRALKEKRVRALVYSKATLAAAVGAVPIPMADIAVLTPIQVGMVAAVGYLHGVEVTRERAVELIATVGAGAGLREAARQLLKMVPGWGPAVGGGVAFAGTVALGETANQWFGRHMQADPEDLRAVFLRAARRARDAFESHGDAAAAMQKRVAAVRRPAGRAPADPDALARALARLDPEAPDEG